ncbi:acyltransferase [Elizabethkingia meningoseptica]|uniref:acyltransferase family protein n=1 Tax=Elizabethkingia meningoseptica TaxID=238 RepID=UPI000999D926|nr:acyltransferase [Elizabethkingia meningoseptica]OPC00150.1 acyltransferase [Elizabethkingia meningoseptica]
MSKTIFSDSKKHYEILDGLRGIAAIMVVMLHILEIFSGGDHTKMMVNHGYLAVDFFFLLSGFVIAHAYDDRWNKMTVKQFFTRRLIRLHPLIIAGMTLGGIFFYFSESEVLFPLVGQTPVWKLILVMFIGYTLLPLPVSMDVHGWSEMHPLNGPAWSLFYEYVANILYALFLRKASTTLLSILVILSGSFLAYYTITSPQGDIVGGWSLTGEQIKIGLTRLLYPFLAGLLLYRIFKPMQLKNGFLLCGLLLIITLAMPRIGGKEYLWMNGTYEAIVILFVFPLILFLGASGSIEGKAATRVCNFLGDISYPLYITHFPALYVYYAWVVNHKITLEEAWPVGLAIMLASIIVAYLLLKFYDIPVRKWLTKRYVNTKN